MIAYSLSQKKIPLMKVTPQRSSTESSRHGEFRPGPRAAAVSVAKSNRITTGYTKNAAELCNLHSVTY